jgi:cell division septation protein DedD
MHRFLRLSLFALSIFASRAAAQGTAPATDPVFVRANQMVTAGQDSAGRAVIDSVLAVTPGESPRYAEALFWRATLSRTAAGAERDYRRIVVEHALSPRAPESLFRLSQLETTRGDRAGARAHLERLLRQHPNAPVIPRASITLAQLAFGDGDLVTGCNAIAAARDGLHPSDVELRNQVEYLGQRCTNSALQAATARDSANATNAAAAAPPTDASGVARAFSVQVAAFDTRVSADSLVRRLTTRGYTARVVGTRAPYRVRVGRYPTRERAAEAARQLNRITTRAVVVEAEPQ